VRTIGVGSIERLRDSPARSITFQLWLDDAPSLWHVGTDIIGADRGKRKKRALKRQFDLDDFRVPVDSAIMAHNRDIERVALKRLKYAHVNVGKRQLATDSF
jgi:hypothetical protein